MIRRYKYTFITLFLALVFMVCSMAGMNFIIKKSLANLKHLILKLARPKVYTSELTSIQLEQPF